MTTPSSIADNHLVLNSRYGQIAASDQMKVYGGDVSMDAVERAARRRRCRSKSIASMQIIYVWSSGTAMQGCDTQQNAHNLDKI